MLFFGYLGEINIMSTVNSVACGFLPFIVYFYFIYEKYAKYSTRGIALLPFRRFMGTLWCSSTNALYIEEYRI